MQYTLYDIDGGLNIDAPRAPNGDSPDMAARLLTCRDLRAHQVTRLEAIHTLAAGQVATREAELVEQDPLVTASAGALHGQGRLLLGLDRGNLADACRIQGMGFRDAQLHTVEFSAATGASSTGNSVDVSAVTDAQRVALTAAASLSGRLACAWIRARRALSLMKTSSGSAALRVLQGTQATLFEPPRARGTR